MQLKSHTFALHNRINSATRKHLVKFDLNLTIIPYRDLHQIHHPFNILASTRIESSVEIIKSVETMSYQPR